MKKEVSKIVKWLNLKNKNANTNGFIVGLSGGIDSAVVAALAKLTKQKVLGIIMPCHSNSQDAKDALLLAKTLKINYKILELDKPYDSFIDILPKAKKMVTANIKPRLRMISLYYYAAKNNCLVLGTGNKTEIMIGYFTKYGDGGCDLLPIANYYKKEVYQLAEFLNIPNAIINKPPSAGLWNNQTDEKEMGIAYSELDEILYRIEHKQKLTKFAKNKIILVKNMIAKSEHKRKLAEIYI